MQDVEETTKDGLCPEGSHKSDQPGKNTGTIGRTEAAIVTVSVYALLSHY